MARATPNVPSAKAGLSKSPIGPFQNTVLASAKRAAKAFTLAGPMSSAIVLGGRASTLTTVPADDERADLLEQRFDHGDLVAHFRAAEHSDVRLLRRRDDLAERSDLLLEEKGAAPIAEQLREPVHARVRAMDRAERVVDIDVGELRQLAAEGLVVLLLFRMEAEVLEQTDAAAAKVVDDLLGRVADAVLGERHVLAEELGEPGGRGLETVLRIGALLRAAEVAGADEPRTPLERVLDRRQRFADARVVGDLAAFEGHVEVDAQKDPLVLDGEIANRADPEERTGHRSGAFAQSFDARSGAGSTIRFENAHSLSSQEKTLPNVSPITWVMVASKFDECASPM